MIACQQQAPKSKSDTHGKNILQYAEGARLFHAKEGYLLQIIDPWNEQKILQEYFLSFDTANTSKSDSKRQILPIPIQSVIALSSTQWSPLLKLGVPNVVKGISEADYVQNPNMRDLLANGQVIEVSANGVFNAEKIVNINPSLILYSPYASGAPEVLVHTGISLLAWPDYFESNPLGRAEWMRILGVLTGTEKEADSWFFAIEERYNTIKKLAQGVSVKPTVFADKAFSGQWYVPGGQSYMATIFRDAGAEYIWKDDRSKASFPLDFETILSKAQQADFWRIAQAADEKYSYEQIAQENELYSSFKAFQERNILFCNTTSTAYFERSQFEPDVILSDFVHLFHPALLPDHQPVYYNRLQ